MKLHESLLNKIVKLCENYQGSDGNVKLKNKLAELDLSPYKQQSTNKEVLVLTEELLEKTRKNK